MAPSHIQAYHRTNVFARSNIAREPTEELVACPQLVGSCLKLTSMSSPIHEYIERPWRDHIFVRRYMPVEQKSREKERIRASGV